MDTETWLREISNTSQGPYLRPFGASASWKSARVLIVGTNPATPLRSEFISFDYYWEALTRDPDRFLEVYRRARRKGDSLTTRRTRELQGYLAPINSLVTNVYPYPASSANRIPNKAYFRSLGRQIFSRLIADLQPRALVLHGQPAFELLEWYRQEHGKTRELIVKTFPHFSGQRVPAGFTTERWRVELSSAAAELKGLEGMT